MTVTRLSEALDVIRLLAAPCWFRSHGRVGEGQPPPVSGHLCLPRVLSDLQTRARQAHGSGGFERDVTPLLLIARSVGRAASSPDCRCSCLTSVGCMDQVGCSSGPSCRGWSGCARDGFRSRSDRMRQTDVGCGTPRGRGRRAVAHGRLASASRPLDGFADLDALAGGLQPGDLWVVTGRSGSGKSVLLHDLLRSVLRQRRGCLHVAREDRPEDVAAWVLAAQARVPLHHLQAEAVSEESLARLRSAVPEAEPAQGYWSVTSTSMPRRCTRGSSTSTALLRARVPSSCWTVYRLGQRNRTSCRPCMRLRAPCRWRLWWPCRTTSTR